MLGEKLVFPDILTHRQLQVSLLECMESGGFAEPWNKTDLLIEASLTVSLGSTLSPEVSTSSYRGNLNSSDKGFKMFHLIEPVPCSFSVPFI